MTDLRMWSQLSPEERAEAVTKAREIIDGGEVRWHVVARMCGIKGGIGLRSAIDQGWRKKRNEERKAMQPSRADLDGDMPSRIDPECLAARLAEIPPDTRTLTGHLFGDPLPGRSAFDKEGPHMAAWTQSRIDQLTVWWNAGIKAPEIAERLGGVTKNAVIGKAHRIGLGEHRFACLKRSARIRLDAAGIPRRERGPKQTPEERAEKAKERMRLLRERRAAEVRPVVVAPVAEPWDGPSISILDDRLSRFMCREIVAGSGVNTMFCGAPTKPGSQFSYCPFHAVKNLRLVQRKTAKPAFVPYRVAA